MNLKHQFLIHSQFFRQHEFPNNELHFTLAYFQKIKEFINQF